MSLKKWFEMIFHLSHINPEISEIGLLWYYYSSGGKDWISELAVSMSPPTGCFCGHQHFLQTRVTQKAAQCYFCFRDSLYFCLFFFFKAARRITPLPHSAACCSAAEQLLTRDAQISGCQQLKYPDLLEESWLSCSQWSLLYTKN